MQDADRSALVRMVLEGVVSLLVMLVTWSVGNIKENLERTIVDLSAHQVVIQGLRDQALIMMNNINRIETIHRQNTDLITDLVIELRTRVRGQNAGELNKAYGR